MAGLDIHLGASVDLDELEGAILRARASELSEIRRRDVRLTTGYGDATTREAMDDEARRARLRYEALSQLLTALREARSDTLRRGG